MAAPSRGIRHGERVRARYGAVALAVGVAAIAWWSALGWVVDLARPTPAVLADSLQTALTRRWQDDRAQPAAPERASNPEWDFMARTFLVLALANDALARPATVGENLTVVDRIIDDTLTLERSHGQRYFLLPYAGARAFVDPSGRSVFVDGEIALMLAARSAVAQSSPQMDELRRRVAIIEAQMRRGPVLSAESYPDEAWVFCNTTALVALRAADHVLGSDHAELIDDWLQIARARLIDPESGLLVSSFTYDGKVLDGPEGSTIWMTTHNLLLLDPLLARAQYERATEALAGGAFRFAWAREWPDGGGFEGRRGSDIDSGAVVPLLGASPGSSGMMILGAAAFGDVARRDALLRSLHLGAFPTERAGGTEFAAAGVVGSSVVLYALRFGPLWERLGQVPG